MKRMKGSQHSPYGFDLSLREEGRNIGGLEPYRQQLQRKLRTKMILMQCLNNQIFEVPCSLIAGRRNISRESLLPLQRHTYAIRLQATNLESEISSTEMNDRIRQICVGDH